MNSELKAFIYEAYNRGDINIEGVKNIIGDIDDTDISEAAYFAADAEITEAEDTFIETAMEYAAGNVDVVVFEKKAEGISAKVKAAWEKFKKFIKDVINKIKGFFSKKKPSDNKIEITVNAKSWNILQKIQNQLLKIGNNINKGNQFVLSKDEMDKRVNKLGEKSIFAQSCEVLGTLVADLIHAGGIVIAANIGVNIVTKKVLLPVFEKMCITIPKTVNELAFALDSPYISEENKKAFMKDASPLIRFCARQKYNKLIKIKERENADGIDFDHTTGKAVVYKDMPDIETTGDDGKTYVTQGERKYFKK